MAIPWAAIIPVVGSVVGALIDRGSQRAANTATAQNVDKQIEFQKDQNATSWQRAVTDIKTAGLNPALAYQKGGADSGSGAAAEIRPELMNSGQRLAQAVDAYNQFANSAAQRRLIYAQERKTHAETAVMQPDAILGQNAEYIRQHGRTRLAKGQSEQFLADKTAEQYMANLGATQQQTATSRQQERLMTSQQILNEQEYMNEWFRKNIAPYLNSTARGVRTIGGIKSAKGGWN